MGYYTAANKLNIHGATSCELQRKGASIAFVFKLNGLSFLLLLVHFRANQINFERYVGNVIFRHVNALKDSVELSLKNNSGPVHTYTFTFCNGEYEVCDVTAYESTRLRSSTRRGENSVFKSIHFGKRFRMYAFRIT